MYCMYTFHFSDHIFYALYKGEEKVYKILEFVGIDVWYRRGKSANSNVPMNIFYGKDETEVEDITTTLANTALFLYLFFDKNKKFEMAHIAGDKHVV